MKTKLKVCPSTGYIITWSNQETEKASCKTVKELCEHVQTQYDKKGIAQTVKFPNGTTYLWGNGGSYLSNAFTSKGRINETQFMQHMQELCIHN